MFNIALKLAYLGTDFYGFQRQPNLRTVEGEIIKALQEASVIENLGQSHYSLAGRTDRGVHALGNVISFRTRKEIIINHLNDYLPQDIRILGSSRVSMGFKARYAYKRYYRYVFSLNNVKSDYDRDMMQKAASMMEGTHNFVNFSKRSERNPIRKVETVRIIPEKDYLLVDVVGESFLWNMVRKMVTVLLAVGRGEMEINDVKMFLDPDLPASITPMPPESLILMDVSYHGVEFDEDSYARERFTQALLGEFEGYKRMLDVTGEMIRFLSKD